MFLDQKKQTKKHKTTTTKPKTTKNKNKTMELEPSTSAPLPSNPPPSSSKKDRSKGKYGLEQAYLQSARRGRMDGLISALTQGVDPHITDSKGRNIAHQLAFYLPTANAHSPTINRKNPYSHNSTHNQNHKTQDFLKEFFHLLITHGIEFNGPDNQGDTPLHLCARKGNVPVIRYLLKYGAKMDLTNNDGLNPFHLAAECNSSDALKVMYYSNPPILDTSGPDGWSSLHFACSGEALLSLVVLLDRGANASASDDDGNTPLHISCIQASGKNTEIIRRLLMSGANPSSPNNRQRTPLHFAVRAGFREAVAQLIDANVDVNLADISGDTALHIAVRDGHCAIASLLLKVNAKNDHKNKNGKTALDIARVDKRMMRLMNDPTGDWRRPPSAWTIGGIGLTFAVVVMSLSVGWYVHKRRDQLL